MGLNVEKPYTAEQITQQFENIFQYNDPKVGGSYYLQCKSEHAKNALHEELAQEYEREMKQNSNENSNESSTKSDLDTCKVEKMQLPIIDRHNIHTFLFNAMTT